MNLSVSSAVARVLAFVVAVVIAMSAIAYAPQPSIVSCGMKRIGYVKDPNPSQDFTQAGLEARVWCQNSGKADSCIFVDQPENHAVKAASANLDASAKCGFSGLYTCRCERGGSDDKVKMSISRTP